LYLSAYFEAHRGEYYDHLLAISQRGEWRAWILFFLAGIQEQAEDAIRRSSRILGLREDFRTRFQRDRGSARLLHLIDLLFRHPYLNIPVIAKELGITFPTAGSAVTRLAKEGILTEVTGKRRDRVYVAEEIVKILE
jgi:Fic family protein